MNKHVEGIAKWGNLFRILFVAFGLLNSVTTVWQLQNGGNRKIHKNNEMRVHSNNNNNKSNYNSNNNNMASNNKTGYYFVFTDFQAMKVLVKCLHIPGYLHTVCLYIYIYIYVGICGHTERKNQVSRTLNTTFRA